MREGSASLAELVAGDLFMEIMDDLLMPVISERRGEVKKLGTVVLGTVRGDLHEIGKNIVATMLRAAGFEVIDLGVDVPPEKFIEAVKKYNADILSMSALLTTTMMKMEVVIKELEKACLRDKVKVIIGGAPITEDFARRIGADAYGRDVVEAVDICKKLVKSLSCK